VVFFFVVAQIVARVRFNQPISLPTLAGGFMIVAGGAIISFWKG
jgi:small multidrug resistance family-3 protein